MSDATDHPLERVVFFSDAVFAIAITLLVIELHAPHLPHHSASADYLHALAGLVPGVVGYVMSFAVIGGFWLGHHRAFSLAVRVREAVIGWNLLLLGAVAFIPFVTAFFSANVLEPVPTATYWGWMAVTAALNLRVNTMATSPPMLAEDAAIERVAFIRLRGVSLLLGSLVAFGIAFVMPAVAPLGVATAPLWRRMFRSAVIRHVQAAHDRACVPGDARVAAS